MKIREIETIPYSIPYKTSNKSNWSQRRGVTSVLVKITSSDGIVGFGEAVSFQSAEMGVHLVDKMKSHLLGQSCFEVEKISRLFNHLGGWNWNHQVNQFSNPILAAIEMACWDIMGKVCGLPVNNFFGGKLRDKSEVLYMLKPGTIKEVVGETKKAVTAGYKTIFYKLSKNTNPVQDVEYIREIRSCIDPDIKLRIDANGSWTIPTAIRILKKLEKYDIEYCEQPVIGIDALKQVKERVPIAIGANEAACSMPAIMEIIKKEAADIIVTDHYNLGGLLALKKAASMAETAGIPLVMHANGESSIGFQAGLQVLSTCANAKYANQYFGDNLIDDIADMVIVPKDGFVEILDLPGIGINADYGKLNKYSKLYRENGEFSVFEVIDKNYLPMFPKF